MPKVVFQPSATSADIELNQKILVSARKSRVPIRFGCASCSCGSCAVKVDDPGALSPMSQGEKDLLTRMGLSLDGTVRLACQARFTGATDVSVDIGFQDSYSPDDLD